MYKNFLKIMLTIVIFFALIGLVLYITVKNIEPSVKESNANTTDSYFYGLVS